MAKLPISVTIITLNEEKNIAHALQSVSWADEIIIVDSGSTDKTVEIATQWGARVLRHPWQGYGQQKNFAQNQTRNDWVLNIDADEVVSPELAQEIMDALHRIKEGKRNTHGFCFPRKTYYLGRWIQHGGWYPNWLIRLVHKQYASWTEPFVHEELKVNGEVTRLKEPLLHYAFPSIREQILTNLRFSELGAQDLLRKGQLPTLKKLILKPLGKFIETYLFKMGFLDGLAGFMISINAAHSMFLKHAFLFEKGISNKNQE